MLLCRTRNAPGVCRDKTSKDISRGKPAWNHGAPFSSCCSIKLSPSNRMDGANIFGLELAEKGIEF